MMVYNGLLLILVLELDWEHKVSYKVNRIEVTHNEWIATIFATHDTKQYSEKKMNTI